MEFDMETFYTIELYAESLDGPAMEIEILKGDTEETFLELAPVGVLGEGGFGQAVLAVSKCAERKHYVVKAVPLKYQHESDDDGSVPESLVSHQEYCCLLRNELAVLSLTARHSIPFCLSLVAYNFTETHLRIVTDYATRGSLDDMIEERKSPGLGSELAKFYCAEIAIGVGYLHKHGVIHRDLNTSNILVNHDYHVVICDFGLSIKASSAIERVGTLDSNAPEVLTDDSPYDKSADWWSVGVTWYKMLTGRNPVWVDELNSVDNVENIISNMIELPVLPNKLANQFLKAILSHDPSSRLGSKAGFQEVLGHPYLAKYADYEKLVRKEVAVPLLRRKPYRKRRTMPNRRKRKVKRLQTMDCAWPNAVTSLRFRKPEFVEFYNEIIIPDY